MDERINDLPLKMVINIH